MGEQIQRAGSTIPSVGPVFDPQNCFLDGAQMLMTKGAVYVRKGAESQRDRVMSVSDGLCFESCGAYCDDGRRSGSARGDRPCCQEGCIDGGREGE